MSLSILVRTRSRTDRKRKAVRENLAPQTVIPKPWLRGALFHMFLTPHGSAQGWALGALPEPRAPSPAVPHQRPFNPAHLSNLFCPLCALCPEAPPGMLLPAPSPPGTKKSLMLVWGMDSIVTWEIPFLGPKLRLMGLSRHPHIPLFFFFFFK